MSLRIVHINKEATDRQARARKMWEEVLKPKWEAKAKQDAVKLFSKHNIKITDSLTEPGLLERL